MRRYITWWCVLAMLVAPAAGCGESGPARHRVHGTVTYQGKPVPVGSIQFAPDASKGRHGPAAFAAIKNGRYDSGAGGRGVIGGPHIVTIEAFDGQNIDPDVLPNGKPLMQGFRKSFDLPQGEDATLDIEISPGS